MIGSNATNRLVAKVSIGTLWGDLCYLNWKSESFEKFTAMLSMLPNKQEWNAPETVNCDHWQIAQYKWHFCAAKSSLIDKFQEISGKRERKRQRKEKRWHW